ncbi:hypothetical protein [Conexibacter sp. SYSU D00693]|uniref:hypothetical protein n=1 Tax=Conexibacter sp. SYSU D00693 TaxID=2812560 RepID=UPI00196A6E03|nr:hypothetical protein [Conexibacter sp. SYSU D00693]
MGSRSRKRRDAGSAPKATATAPAAPPRTERPPRRSGAERDAEARAALEPLAPGERPTWVTVAAVVAAVMAVANVVAVLAGADFQGDERSAVSTTVVTTALLVLAAGGMWKARYWAVLGFETILLFQILVLCLALMRAEGALAALVVTAAIAFLGLLFWKLIRAMARIQMPQRDI